MRIIGLLLALMIAPMGQAQDIAIINATAWTLVGDQPTPNATIIVRGGRIAEISTGRDAPAGLEVIDAAGRPVTPALFGALTSLSLVEVSSVDETDDRAVASGPTGAAFDVRYALNPNSLVLEVARSEGLGRALAVPTSSAHAAFVGLGALLHLDVNAPLLERGAAAMVVRIGGPSSGAGGSRAAQWILLRDALDAAKRYRPGRQESERPQNGISELDLRALHTALRAQTPFLLRVERESDIRQAILLARDYGLRVVLAGASEAWRVAAELAAAKIPVIVDPFADLPMSYDEIGARPDNVVLLARAGVQIAFMVDAQGIYLTYSPAQSLREGAGRAVGQGLPYAQALAAITRQGADIWNVSDRAGTIEVGKDADLVIWDGDPLEASSAPAQVLAAGKRLSLATRRTQLRDRYHPSLSNEPWPPSYRR